MDNRFNFVLKCIITKCINILGIITYCFSISKLCQSILKDISDYLKFLLFIGKNVQYNKLLNKMV